MSEHDPEGWLSSNPAAPAVPTLLSPQDWAQIVKAINAPPMNATAAVIGRIGPWIGSAWEPTPWGGMQRVKFIDDEGTVHFGPIRITVLTPGEVRRGRCIPAGGESRRGVGTLLRDRVTGDLDLIRGAEKIDPHADLPGRRTALVPTPDEERVRAGARRISLQRLRWRAVVGAASGLFGGQLISLLWLTGDPAWSLAGLAAGGLAAVTAPFAAARAGARLSRPLTLHAEDPRTVMLCVLQYYLAHAEQLGERADALILEAWRLLYGAAGADPRSAAAMANLDGRAQALVQQAETVASFLDAQAEVERAAARPKVEAIEEHEDEIALAVLDSAPDEAAIAELTHELEMDAEARRSAARRLDNPEDTEATA